MSELMQQSMFFGAFLSIGTYLLGMMINRKFRLAICNPLLIAVIVVMGVLLALRIDYKAYEESAQYISYLLTPSTVCLAIPLYRQMKLLRQNAKAIALGSIAGVLAIMGGILLLSVLFGLTHEQYVTLLPKSITTAIGMGISEELGGIVTITVAVIILTGILGNMIVSGVCRLFRIEEPVAKGLAVGTAAHAIGTARAMEMGEIEGAMSSLAIAVSGTLTACTASLFAMLW